MTIKKRKGRSKINLYRGPKFRVSVLYSSRKQEKAKIFRRGRTEESQKCWRPKVHVWPSLRTRGQHLGGRRWTFVPALLWCEVYARRRLNHSAAVGWWLLKHRRVKTNKQGNKETNGAFFRSPKRWHQLQHSWQSVETEDSTNIPVTKKKYSVNTFKNQQEITSHLD